MISRRFLLTISLGSALAFAACNCGEPLTPVKGTGLPVGNQGEGRVLIYVGDEPLAMFYAASGQLRFTRKEQDGTPVAGDKIKIDVHGSAVSVPGDSYITDEGGGIEVPVVAGTEVGEATVIARATDVDGSIDEAVVHIDVEEDPETGIVVTVTADTRIPVVRADARVLIGADPPSCAGILAGSAEPTPFTTLSYTAFPSSQTVAQVAAHSMAIVVVDGYGAEGQVVARGCGAAGPLPGGITTPIDVSLDQGQSTLAGNYDVLMHMALGQALPHPYDTDVDLITALLSDPAGFALYFVLREIDRETGFTTFVTHNGVELTYDEVSAQAAVDPGSFPTWSFGRDQLNTLLTNQLGQTYTEITDIGASLRDIVTDFEVGAQLQVQQNDDGTLTVGEQWRDLVLYWPLPCASGDMACARRPVTLADLNLAPVTSEYGATDAYAPNADVAERYLVTTNPHGLTLRYGDLLVAILEQVVFPSVPGGQAGDDFGAFLQNIVGCANIATSVTSDPTASQFVEGICDAGLQLAGDAITSQLESLQVDAADPSVEGLQSSGSFALLDKDQDLTTEIVDEYTYNIEWYNPNDPNATQDISAPITGDGLRERPACDADSQCGAGLVCSPRGSYLKVAQVELGCDHAKGNTVGGASCVGDSDCATGLCTPVGAANALQCYRACNLATDCTGSDNCSDTGGALDLDSELNGLGSVPVRGCVAP
ncbi:MAG TPA: hypothetical protein VGO62_15265 [Myxococcota bacterium]|jgi:hypothetical protein